MDNEDFDRIMHKRGNGMGGKRSEKVIDKVKGQVAQRQKQKNKFKKSGGKAMGKKRPGKVARGKAQKRGKKR